MYRGVNCRHIHPNLRLAPQAIEAKDFLLSVLMPLRCRQVVQARPVTHMQPIPRSRHQRNPSRWRRGCPKQVQDRVLHGRLRTRPSSTKRSGPGARKSMRDNGRRRSGGSRSGWRAIDRPRTRKYSRTESSSDCTRVTRTSGGSLGPAITTTWDGTASRGLCSSVRPSRRT